MTEAARREQENQKKKVQPKLALSVAGAVSRNNMSTPPRHSNGSLTPPVTPPITPSSSFRSSTPTGLCVCNVCVWIVMLAAELLALLVKFVMGKNFKDFFLINRTQLTLVLTSLFQIKFK